MLEFKNLTWEHKDVYTDYYRKTPVHYAEYSFFTLWAWQHAYPIQISFDEDKENNLCWLKSGGPLPGIFGPVGDWEAVKDWDKVLSNFKTGDLIFDVPEGVKEILSGRSDLKFTEDRDQHEYVYSVKELISLKGKKFAHKRNRVRAFLDGYEWDYYPMEKKYFDEVMNFQERWRIHRDETMNEDEAASLSDEDSAIQNALKKWDDFNFSGGILRVDEKITAYTIAQKLDDKNIDILFEKAFGEYAGSYQAINYLFLKNQASDFEFVNREEDMGEAGLREAKMSYNPVVMLKKYQAEIL